MAYVGTPPADRVLSSADIAQGAVTLNDINFTDVPTNMDITGTIDKHTMRLADGVTVTGDVTISDDLVLAKISDDGDAITMTNDGSSRTITGSGSIEASTLAATPQYESLTGMTGVLDSTVTNNAGVASGVIGSAVTGNPALNLANATFPAGMPIQVVTNNEAFGGASLTLNGLTNATDSDANGFEITGVTAGNKLVAFVAGGHCKYYSSTVNRYSWYRIGFSPNIGSDEFFDGIAVRVRTTGFYFHVPISISASYTIPSGVTSVKVLRRLTNDHATNIISWESDQSSAVSCTIMEIQQ